MIETYRNNPDSMPTPEYAKKWTETSPNSKLREINKLLNIPKLQNLCEVKKLKNKISNREYRSFQKMVGVPHNRCNGKLGAESLSYLENYTKAQAKKKHISIQTNSHLSNLQGNIGQIENFKDTIDIQRKEAQYLASHESMDKSEYNKLFSGREKLQQGQLGDCYLVSAILELSRCQHFDTLMRTSISRVKRENGDLGYQIKIPLGEPSGRKILLKESEIPVAKINGNTGYKILELAYAKNKLRKNDKKGNRYQAITTEELNKISGGWTKEVLQCFLGKENISFNDFGYKSKKEPLYKLPNDQKTQINNYLKNFTPSIGNKFVSLSSLSGSSDRKSYVIGNKTLYKKHAYTLAGVNKNNKGDIQTIRVLNPRNRKGNGNNYQDFTPEEFYKGFSAMSCGKIRTNTFLNEEVTKK